MAVARKGGPVVRLIVGSVVGEELKSTGQVVPVPFPPVLNPICACDIVLRLYLTDSACAILSPQLCGCGVCVCGW